MDKIIIATIIGFFITYLAVPVILRIAQMKKLYDLPDDRKIHDYPISSLGGVGIFAGFILAFLLGAPDNSSEIAFLSAAFLVVFFLGLKDDVIILTPLKKFIGQLIAAGILIFKGNFLITGLHGFLGIHDFPQQFSILFTFLTILVITNSFNLIDGIDGLAGSLGLLSTLLFGSYFLYIGAYLYATLAFSMSGSLLAFLIFNVSPAKIFMGDTGSLLLGIANAILAIKFIELGSHPTSAITFPAAAALGFAILYVPLFDTLRIFSLRILHRKSPFSPDKNHVHHILLEKGCNHPTITIITVLFNIAIVALTYIFNALGNTILLSSLIATGFISVGLLIYSNRKARRQLLQKTLFRKENPDLKVINLENPKEKRKAGEL
ncbi:MAG: undecaprenyl/decaprenyl-phosphate alpha-N-acetylglucosaminyl 1-phosphate transferase [Bacteroidetes bacterium]|nr:undecaprenyl/decaprenyl-phosphate alpha-N-acetylglucosaminyl 1-phosphate transferase [Bacteroidota bacterium]